MRNIDKPWLLGLVQAFLIFCFSFLLYFVSSRVLSFNAFPYGTIDSALITAVRAVAFIFAVITYVLTVFAYPVYLSTRGKVVEGIKTVVFTALFLLIFLAMAVSCIYIFTHKSSLSRGPLDNPYIYVDMSQKELLMKAEEVKIKAENARLDYESQQMKKTVPAEVINIAPTNQIYPYSIDINTGEKTPINP